MAAPSVHVLIGNLPPAITHEMLKKTFEAYGTVKSCRLNGKGLDDRRSAAVEFGTLEEAQWLVDNLDGNIPLDLECEVTVEFRPPKGQGKGCGAGVVGVRPAPYPCGGVMGGMACGMVAASPAGMMGIMGQPCTFNDWWMGLIRHRVLPGGLSKNDERTVCIHGLPADTTEPDLLKVFSTFGAIYPNGVRMPMNEDGSSMGTGMVNFLHLESALLAIATLNNTMMPDGRFLRLNQWMSFSKFKGNNKGGAKGAGRGGACAAGAAAPAAPAAPAVFPEGAG